jgi:hypothetical protein
MSRWRYPTFTIHRVDVSGPRDATVISRSATAAVSLRIVPDQNIAEICQDFEAYTRNLFVKLNTDCELKITIRKTADWWLADPENEYFQMLQEAIEKVTYLLNIIIKVILIIYAHCISRNGDRNHYSFVKVARFLLFDGLKDVLIRWPSIYRWDR